MRRFVVGDIHGCAKALRTLIETIDPTPEDELIFLGDYIDRGPDSRNVVEQLLELQTRCRMVALCGNHELMMLTIINRGYDDAIWMANGGRATVTSYGGNLSKIPSSHLGFFARLQSYYETDDTICAHAGYNPMLPMDQQDAVELYWNHLSAQLPAPHLSGKRVFVGHTPQGSGDILDGGHVVCIDTYCFGGGYLTAFDLDTDELIQTNHHGHLRRHAGAEWMKRLQSLRGRCLDFARRGYANVNESKSKGESETEKLPLSAPSNPKQA
jgi:serine/threonine protein phosphatase 1